MDKIIGTHNTMSYLPPKHWWQKPFNWLFAQCQNKYPDNDTCVDFRIYYNEDTKDWEFAHGLISYDSIFGAFLNICGSITSVSCKYVRLILERDGHEDDFINLCKRYEKNYPKITFLGGYRKSDWKQLYKFEAEDPTSPNYIPVYQWVGSMAEDARWYERFIPRLYAKRMNKTNLHKLKEGINLFDFL